MTYTVYDPFASNIAELPNHARHEYVWKHGMEIDFSDYDSFIFYHAMCQDGFFAAAIAKMALLDRGFKPLCVPIAYGERGSFAHKWAKDLKDKYVTIVDFSISPSVFAELAMVVKSINVYDHHSSVYELEWACGDIEKLPKVEGYVWGRNTNNGFNSVCISPVNGSARCFYEYDASLSGAALTKKVVEFNNDCNLEISEGLVAHFQDRDLFTKALPHTDLVYIYVSKQDWFSNNNIDKGIEFLKRYVDYTREMASDPDLELPFFSEARAYKHCYDFEIDRLLRENMSTGSALGLLVPVVACDKGYVSDAATKMYNRFKDAPFVMCVSPSKFITGEYSVSLRRGANNKLTDEVRTWLKENVLTRSLSDRRPVEEFVCKDDGGLHLGMLATILAEEINGATGGGHSKAAGITIPYANGE